MSSVKEDIDDILKAVMDQKVDEIEVNATIQDFADEMEGVGLSATLLDEHEEDEKMAAFEHHAEKAVSQIRPELSQRNKQEFVKFFLLALQTLKVEFKE